MGKIIAFANQKGGVGKTTSTYNIGYALSKLKKKVLMVDLDPQHSLTISTGYDENDFENTIESLFMNDNEDIRTCIYPLSDISNNLFIVPSSIALQSAEMLMTAKMGREKMLKLALSPIMNDFDYILIDCPPQMGNLAINALACANSVIVCCKTDYLSYQGMDLIKDSIKELVSYDINSNLKIEGIIATFFEKVVKDNRSILELMQQNDNVLGVIKKTSNIYKDILSGAPATMCYPKSDIAQEYINIAKKIIKNNKSQEVDR